MRILICGVGGRMGREVAKLTLDGVRGAVPVAGFDVIPVDTREFRTYTDWNAVEETPDCIIDFSHHSATRALLEFATARGIPAVIATTGHTDEELAEIDAAAEKIAIFRSANMSLGVALLVELAKLTAKTFPDADIEIIEKHHNRKLDVPSGTALLLAHRMQEVLTDSVLLVGRHENGKRTAKEIGIHSLRLGNEVGTHEIIIATGAETITLKHEAENRSLFANGALAAAKFLEGKSAGLYSMGDII